jgi:hypothetical protein
VKRTSGQDILHVILYPAGVLLPDIAGLQRLWTDVPPPRGSTPLYVSTVTVRFVSDIPVKGSSCEEHRMVT